jgi:hypothetical protein
MAFVHGSKSSFNINAKDISAFLDNVDFSNAVDTAETSTFGSTSKTYINGLTDATFSIAGKWDPTATTGPDAVLDALVGAAASTFIYGPQGTTAGMVKYTGSAILTSYKVTGPIGGVVSLTADFQCSGAITRTTF